MDTYADKSQKNEKRSASDEIAQRQSSSPSAFPFVDNRPASIAQKKLQELADANSQVKQLSAFQVMTDNSPQARQAARLREIANRPATLQAGQSSDGRQLKQEARNPLPSKDAGVGNACIQRQVSEVKSKSKSRQSSYWFSDFPELQGVVFHSQEAAEEAEENALTEREEKAEKEKIAAEKARVRLEKAQREYEEAFKGQDPDQESMEISYVTGKGSKKVPSTRVDPRTAKKQAELRYKAAQARKLKGNAQFFHFQPVEGKPPQHFKIQQGHDYELYGLNPVQGGGFSQSGSSGATFDAMAKIATSAAESLDSPPDSPGRRERVARDINRASRGSKLVGEYADNAVFGPTGLAAFGQVMRAEKGRAPKATKAITKALMSASEEGFESIFGKGGSYIGLKLGSESGPARLRAAEEEGGDVSEGSDIEELEQSKKRPHGKKDGEQKRASPVKKKRKKKASSSTEGLPSVYTINGRHYDVNDPRVRAQGQCLWDTLRTVYGYSAEALESAAEELALNYEQYVDDTDVWRLLQKLGATGMTLDVWQYGDEGNARRTVMGDGNIVLGLAYGPDGLGHYIPPR